jgi:hypothetical protein
VHPGRTKVNVSPPDAPVTQLLYHAIELYLKAFLRVRGLSIQQIKDASSAKQKALQIKMVAGAGFVQQRTTRELRKLV